MYNLKFVSSAATPLSLAAMLYLAYEEQRFEFLGGRDAEHEAGGENFTVLATRNYYPGLIIRNIREMVIASDSRERKKRVGLRYF